MTETTPKVATRARSEAPLDGAAKGVLNGFGWALFALFALIWLRPIVGKQSDLIFWRLLFEGDLPAAWASLGVALGALILTLGLRNRALPSFASLAEWMEPRLGWICAATLPFYALLILGATHRHPFSLDEYSVLLQSEIFASGHFSARIAPELLDWTVPRAAQGNLLHVNHATGELISSYWPGMALLMAPFSFFGAAWLCAPTLTSLSIWVAARAARQMTGSREAAAWTTIFFLTSPVIAFNAASFYAMPAHLLFNAAFCWLLSLQTRRAALWAGIVGSFALVLHNPLPHLLFAAPWLIWVVWRRRDLLWPLLAGYCAFAALVVAWGPILGRFDLSPEVAALRLGRPAVAGGPLSGIASTLHSMLVWPGRDFLLTRLASLGKIVIWAAPGTLALALAGRKTSFYARLLTASFALTFAFYLFVRFDQGAGWGYRYVHAAWLALPILAGAWLAQLEPGKRFGALSIRRFFGCCALGSLLILIPQRAVQVSNFISKHTAQIPRAAVPNGVSLTFIDIKHGYHTGDLVHNDPFLRNRDWKLVHRGDAADQKLARRVLIAPRLQGKGNWGQIWVGDGFTRFARSK